MTRSLLFTIGLALLGTIGAQAGHEMKDTKETVVPESPFDKGRREFQVSIGAFTSFSHSNSNQPDVTDGDLDLRLGWMLNSPDGEGWLRGNFEFLVEAHGAGVIEGPETGLVGLNLMMRYNFVQPEARLVPYFQLQAGGIYTDISDDPNQRLVGSDFDFFLGGGFGLRWFVNERCALTLEADYRHISNAGFADRNLGLNSLGGFLGFSTFF
ncbi:MAG: lipid 3-O-deacylase [Chthoniobacter sp.]|jgi:hypothetical protein|nr:lipid 3-O-deacylase [Chthoniobacter sp.]